LIRRAKAHARQSGKSVSQLVADYFAVLDHPMAPGDESLPPVTRSLYGALAPAQVDETEYYPYLAAKHR